MEKINSINKEKHDIENQLNNIIIEKQNYEKEFYKENFIKEFKFLLLNGFYMYFIYNDFISSFDFSINKSLLIPVFIYTDMTFKNIYFDLSNINFQKVNFINSKYLFNFNEKQKKIILKIPISELIDKKIHYFFYYNHKNNNQELNMFFTLFLQNYNLSLYHPYFNLYNILYDGIELL